VRRQARRPRGWLPPGLLIAALLLTACGERSPTPGPGRLPVRLVLVTLDTLRYDRFDAERMPALWAASQHGLRFSSCHAATSVTLPTHASLLSGLHPWQHGALRNGVVLDDGLLMFAERLRLAGFRTGAVVASFPLERRFRCDQGFETYSDEFVLATEKGSWNEQEVPGGLFSSPADAVTDEALELLAALGRSGQAQFLFVHYFDAHAPYGESRGETIELEELLRAARHRDAGLPELVARAEQGYDDDVRFMDGQLGRLLDALAADAQRFETHVLVTADHGESFGDDGSFGHGKRVTPQQVHVPCVLLSPRVTPGVCDDLAASVDVVPTLLALAGLPPDPALPGRDLLAAAPRGQAVLGMRSLFDAGQHDVRSDGRIEPVDALCFYLVRDGSWFAGDAGHVERLSGGSGSPDDVARLFGDLGQQVRARLEAMLEAGDPETRAALRALGYTR